MRDIIIIYITLINLSTFIAYGVDKAKAKRGSFRISEKMLLLLALSGGSIGALMGMQVFHHKTKHAIFKYGIPSIIVIKYILTILFMYREYL